MKDKNKIEMEDISSFQLERSANYKFWEKISYQEVKEQILNGLPEDKIKSFLRVVRTGSPFKLNKFFYRIKY